jgi:hypothetical protein
MGDLLTSSTGVSLRTVCAQAAVAVLATTIPQYRLAYGDEIRLHAQLAEVIAGALPDQPLLREYALGAAGRIDFYLPALRLGLEVKVKGGPSAVQRQLQRYLGSRDIEHLVLITSRPYLASLATTLPADHFTVLRLREGHL